MQNTQKLSQPLPLAGAKNVRDLGGYRTEEGDVTRFHAFLRADSLHALTDSDCRFLYDYGVRHIVDLRSQPEIDRAPDRLPEAYPEISYLNIPIQDYVRANRYSGEFPPSMWQLYEWMLDDSRASFLQVFRSFAQNGTGCTLFHCSGGKDRTGMVSMLLLKLAGVDEPTIVADYALSEKAMVDLFPLQAAEMESRGLVVPPYILQSPPENMERALDYLKGKYRSAADYLRLLGLSAEEVSGICGRMLA